jgi:hypothetical protein
MAVPGGVTKDGRCFRCVQRRRWITGEVQPSQDTPPQHLLRDGEPICLLPKPLPFKGDDEARRAYKRKWVADRLRTDPAYLKRHREGQRCKNYQRLYGITLEQREALYASQAGVCALCEVNEAEVVDHDHQTGKVRGLLCNKCNLMLGHAEDDVIVLQAAIEYLRKHSP